MLLRTSAVPILGIRFPSVGPASECTDFNGIAGRPPATWRVAALIPSLVSGRRRRISQTVELHHLGLMLFKLPSTSP